MGGNISCHLFWALHTCLGLHVGGRLWSAADCMARSLELIGHSFFFLSQPVWDAFQSVVEVIVLCKSSIPTLTSECPPAHVWRTEEDAECPACPSCLVPAFTEPASCYHLASLASQEAFSVLVSLPHPNAGVTGTQGHPRLLCGGWNLNSGHHMCAPSALITEP